MSSSSSSCSTFAIYDTVSMLKRTSVHRTHLGHNNKRCSRAFPSTPMCSSPPVNFSNVLSVPNLPLPATLSSNHHRTQTSSWDGLGTFSRRCFTHDEPLLEVMIATLPKGGLLLGCSQACCAYWVFSVPVLRCTKQPHFYGNFEEGSLHLPHSSLPVRTEENESSNTIRKKKPQKRKCMSRNVYSEPLQGQHTEYILFWDFHKGAINSWRLANKYVSRF